MRGEHTVIGQRIGSRTSREWLTLMMPDHKRRYPQAALVFGVSLSTISLWDLQDKMPLHARIIAALYTGELPMDELEDMIEGAL